MGRTACAGGHLVLAVRYRDFINALLAGGHEQWFAWVIMFGEMAVGIGLIIGMLTGVAAFFGALMNISFLLAGTASTNPVMFTLAIGLILAWKVAGYYGVDRYLLPLLGTPWRPGSVVGRRPGASSVRSPSPGTVGGSDRPQRGWVGRAEIAVRRSDAIAGSLQQPPRDRHPVREVQRLD